MNAADHVHSLTIAQAIASVITLVRHHFPAANASLMPWRDDPETRLWHQPETLDIAFYFPGWSPRLQCRSLLMQLSLSGDPHDNMRHLIGILIRGMTYDGERWRLATIGDWQPAGSHLPEIHQIRELHQMCREMFSLFPSQVPPDQVT